jgi:hypothetical protein
MRQVFEYFGEAVLHETQPNDQPQGQWSASRISMLSKQVEENHHTTPLSIFRIEPVLTALSAGSVPGMDPMSRSS